MNSWRIAPNPKNNPIPLFSALTVLWGHSFAKNFKGFQTLEQSLWAVMQLFSNVRMTPIYIYTCTVCTVRTVCTGCSVFTVHTVCTVRTHQGKNLLHDSDDERRCWGQVRGFERSNAIIFPHFLIICKVHSNEQTKKSETQELNLANINNKHR